MLETGRMETNKNMQREAGGNTNLFEPKGAAGNRRSLEIKQHLIQLWKILKTGKFPGLLISGTQPF